ncbi:MAG: helix-turn-helix transcriptional regulator [Candidatus Fournierella pullistercoris]|uniref:Helix-turn-helix transcriptional regulator n=1 Tax=Candidatus Allofournierella pullistercoris TaxID=2838597 RepID=A0A948WRB7_9FIRM|nr:helix-turn-helix transcriptional regulator [Candidatus Fournierella pullistercoris]
MPLHNRVATLRSEHHLNQQQLGTLVGVSRQTISLIERGDYNPSITLALRIAAVFQQPVESIFFLTEEETT